MYLCTAVVARKMHGIVTKPKSMYRILAENSIEYILCTVHKRVRKEENLFKTHTKVYNSEFETEKQEKRKVIIGFKAFQWLVQLLKYQKLFFVTLFVFSLY